MSIHCHCMRCILLKCIEILLRSDLRIAFVLIIAAFCVHIVHHPDWADASVGDAGAAELVCTELWLHIGQVSAGRQCDKKHAASAGEGKTVFGSRVLIFYGFCDSMIYIPSYLRTEDLASCCLKLRTCESFGGADFRNSATAFLPRVSVSKPLSESQAFICWTELELSSFWSASFWSEYPFRWQQQQAPCPNVHHGR